MRDWLAGRGLATRLMLTFGALVVVTALVVWLVDRAIAPRVLEQRLRGMMRRGMMGDLRETQDVLAATSGIALAIALLVAFWDLDIPWSDLAALPADLVHYGRLMFADPDWSRLPEALLQTWRSVAMAWARCGCACRSGGCSP